MLKRCLNNSLRARKFIFAVSSVIDRSLAALAFGLCENGSEKQDATIVYKKRTCFFYSALLTGSLLCAQTPTYFNSATLGGANSFPFNNFTNSRQVSWFFPTGSFGTLPPALLITDVYLNFVSTGTYVYPSLEIKLKTSTGTGMTGLMNGPVETGFTTVLSATNYTLVTGSGQWKKFTLQTPFVWNNTSLPLVVQFQHNSTTSPGPTLNQPIVSPGPGNARQWADFNASTNTGVGSQLIDFGIDGVPVQITNSVSCSALGSATANIIGSIGGPYTFTWTPTAQTGSVATGLIPGNYTLTVHDASFNITYTIGATFSPLIPYTGTVQSSGVSCNGLSTGTAGIALGGGSGNSTYLWTNGTSSFTTATLSGLSPGNYSVTVSDLLTSCVQSQTFSITQPPPVTLAVTAASPSACVNNPVLLTGAMSGGTPAYTYTWTGGGATAQQTVTQATGGSYIYTLTAMDNNSCAATSTIGVSFVNFPVLSIQNLSICLGQTATLSVSGASTYTWLPGNTNGSTYTASPVSTSAYTVVGTGSACSTQVTASVTVKPVPSLTFNTFSITCASLGSATVVPSGGIGPFTYTWLPINQTGPNVSGLNPGSHTIIVFDSSTGCTTYSTTTFTSLIPLTGNLVYMPSLTCNGYSNAAASFTNIAGGSAVQNYSWTNGPVSILTPSTSSLGGGQWSLTVTDALTGCQVFSVFTISQPPASTLNLAASVFTACVGNSIVLTGTNSGGSPGYTYTWTNGPLIDTYTVNGTAAGNFVYTLTSTDTHNCLTSNTIAIDFIPNPVLTVNNFSICPLETGTLSVSGASSYTWNNNTVGNTLVDNPLSSQQYTVTGSALGCTSIATASIILKGLPISFATSNSPRCNGQSLSMNGYGGVSYTWSGPNGFVSSTQNSILNPVNVSNGGVYHVTVTAANSCTSAAAITIVVHPTPTLSAAGSTVCSNGVLLLYASSFPSASYLWSGPLSFTSTLQNPSINSPAIARSGNYQVKVTSVQGCTNTALINALVVPPPSLTTQLNSHSLCSQAFNGSPNTITLTAGGASTYTLSTAPDLFNSNPGGPVSLLTAIPPYIGIASATLSGSNGICTVTTSLTFSIIPNPTVTINNYTPPVICAGQSFTYTSQGATSYTWNSATPGFTTYNNGGVAVSNPSINSVFSVYGGSLGCNSASQTSTISVFNLPVVSIAPGNSSICIGSSTLLTAEGTATSFSWQPSIGLNQQNGPQVIAAPHTSQIYTLTGAVNNCTSSTVASVTVLDLPKPVIHTTQTLVCANETITLIGDGGDPGSDQGYRWYAPGDFEYGDKTLNIVALTRQNTTYTLTVTDKNNCKNSTSIFIRVNPLPSGNLLGTKMQGCVPFWSEFNFYSQATTGSVSTSWDVDGKTYPGITFEHFFTKVGEHTITGKLLDNQTGCLNTQTTVVSGFPVPKANFKWLPEKPIEGLDDVLFSNSSEGEKQELFGWFFIDNKGYHSEQENTSYLFPEAGLYPVAFVVTNSDGCSDTIVKAITIEPDFNFYVPNAFTPNGDERNDIFLPIARGVKLYDMKIFNRGGDLIFHTTDLYQGWDGIFNGEPGKQDVYCWKATLSTIHGEAKTYTGQLTLLR